MRPYSTEAFSEDARAGQSRYESGGNYLGVIAPVMQLSGGAKCQRAICFGACAALTPFVHVRVCARAVDTGFSGLDI